MLHEHRKPTPLIKQSTFVKNVGGLVYFLWVLAKEKLFFCTHNTCHELCEFSTSRNSSILWDTICFLQFDSFWYCLELAQTPQTEGFIFREYEKLTCSWLRNWGLRETGHYCERCLDYPQHSVNQRAPVSSMLALSNSGWTHISCYVTFCLFSMGEVQELSIY